MRTRVCRQGPQRQKGQTGSQARWCRLQDGQGASWLMTDLLYDDLETSMIERLARRRFHLNQALAQTLSLHLEGPVMAERVVPGLAERVRRSRSRDTWSPWRSRPRRRRNGHERGWAQFGSRPQPSPPSPGDPTRAIRDHRACRGRFCGHRKTRTHMSYPLGALLRHRPRSIASAFTPRESNRRPRERRPREGSTR